MVLGAGCGVSPGVTVIHLNPGQKGEQISGDTVKLRRGGQEAYVGLRGGFYVVRSADDWRNAWPSGNAPPYPAALDPARTMLLLGVSDSDQMATMKIDRAVENSSVMLVYVKETSIGQGCTEKPDRPPFDAVITSRSDKPVKFIVSAEQAESCGDPPAVTVNCRVNNGQTWAPKIAATPGDTVDCEMQAASRGRFALTDQALTLSELPGGSTAKLAYSKAPVRGSFVADVFGVYGVHGEATDDGDRRTHIVAQVEVLPPKTKDVLVQLVWTNFDASDDPETFPRVKLRAIEETPAKQLIQSCASDAPRAGFCTVESKHGYTTMKLNASSKRLPIDVQYTDERIEKGPEVCVQLFFDGQRTANVCDKEHRAAGARWQVGTLEMPTGTFYDPNAIADAGAAEGGASDASADAAKK